MSAKEAIMAEVARFDDNVKGILRDHMAEGTVTVAVNERYADITVEVRPKGAVEWGGADGGGR